jgi:hypothetical protein
MKQKAHRNVGFLLSSVRETAGYITEGSFLIALTVGRLFAIHAAKI